ncbi:hypothetical protein J4G48_0047105 [Bradyrhizobium barranii subsp. apii]|uniref:hypothetical protein n=1 Tax=Bradyrhizobium barranii TaxID=2992140 RepID=UPI001AA121FF|nr:hypothetical protein [Bradyrhizobium barranii]UPT96487.1 hypothetical protein J4G48_0047105 [Bradyrhizobium barranii subsp. apii]
MPAALPGIWLPITNIQSSVIDHQVIADTRPHEPSIDDELIDNPNGRIQSSSRLLPIIRSWQAGDRNRHEQTIASGYGQLIANRLDDGWSAYLVTVTFPHLVGPRHVLLARMRNEVQRVYSTLVTYVHRRPRTAPTDKLPVLIGVADLPVAKREKANSPSSCNGGLHFHAILVLPASSRLRGSVVDHFASNADRYAGSNRFVANVHVVPVTHDIHRATDYVFKSVIRRRISYEDAVLVLPRSRSELSSADQWGLERRGAK